MKTTKVLFMSSEEPDNNSNNAYDIFISYRREGGADKARVLKTELEKRGFNVFLDFDELKDGIFDERIMDAIKGAPIFMLLLSPNALDRCCEEGDWVRKEIEFAIKTERHIIPVNPDLSFKNFPISTPPFIVKGVQQHQISEIMFGQLFNASMDKMVTERIRPALAEVPKKRSLKGPIIACVIAVIIIASVVATLVFGDGWFLRNEQEPSVPVDTVKMEQPVPPIVVEEEPVQTVKPETPVDKTPPHKEPPHKESQPKPQQPVEKPAEQPKPQQPVEKPVEQPKPQQPVEKPAEQPQPQQIVVTPEMIKAEIDKAFAYQFDLFKSKYPQVNLYNMQAYQEDSNALYSALTQLTKNFKAKYNPNDSIELFWIDSYCNDVMTEQYAQFNEYLLESSKSQMENNLKSLTSVQTSQSYVENANCGLNMKMVYVEGGSFQMGATSEQGSDAWDNEKPVHSVTLDSYYIAECEVTQAQWQKIMGTTVYQQRDKKGSDNSMRGVGDNHPMYYVSWEEAQDFCRELSRITGKTYVLPTEAQWEYAARGGKHKEGTQYSGSYSVDAVAWYSGNSGKTTHPVKQKRANKLGLYDMSGNVDEWCSDWYGEKYYSSSSQTNPTGPSLGCYRVLRGGSWICTAGYCRVSDRSYSTPSSRFDRYGFRVVCLP